MNFSTLPARCNQIPIMLMMLCDSVSQNLSYLLPSLTLELDNHQTCADNALQEGKRDLNFQLHNCCNNSNGDIKSLSQTSTDSDIRWWLPMTWGFCDNFPGNRDCTPGCRGWRPLDGDTITPTFAFILALFALISTFILRLRSLSGTYTFASFISR